MQVQAKYRQSAPYTQVTNDIFDYWQAKLGGTLHSVLNAVFRLTAGWHKDEDIISNYQLQKKTGFSRRTIIRACKKLFEIGLITRKENYAKRGDRKANSYGICMHKILSKDSFSGQLRDTTPRVTVSPLKKERVLEKKVNDCAHTREEKEDESLTCSASSDIAADQEVSLEELEMQRMLDEHLTKLEQSPFEQVVDEIECVAPLPPIDSKRQEFRAVAPPTQKSSLRIVSSKSQIANVFNVPVASSENYNGRKLPVEAHIARFDQKQLEALSFLESTQIDADYKTKSWWACNFSLSRLKEVYAEAVRRKATSIAAYMQTLLKKGSVVMNSRIETNALFAKKFREEQKWYALHINAKHAVFEFCGVREEVEFNMPIEQFSGYMQRKHALYQSNCRI